MGFLPSWHDHPALGPSGRHERTAPGRRPRCGGRQHPADRRPYGGVGDGRGQGGRVRARRARRGTDRAGEWRDLARCHRAHRGLAAARRRPRRPPAELAQPRGRGLRRGRAPACRRRRTRARAPGGRSRGARQGSDPPAPRRRHGPRRCRARLVAAAVSCRAAGRAAGRGRGGRSDGPPRLQRRPERRVQRPGPEQVRLGSRDRPSLRAAPGPAPSGRDRRDADRPTHPPHDEPGRRRAGRDRPEPHDPAAAGDDA